MAEMLVNAVADIDPDPAVDRLCWKRGHVVVVMEDGHEWGVEEVPPKFSVIKLPLVPVARVVKYLDSDVDPALGIVRASWRRAWRVRWVDMPLAARQKLAAGSLTVRVAAYGYTGPFDYTWAQVRSFFRNDVTGLDETLDP